MHPHVRDLWKRFILVARDYPGGASVVRERARAAFRANAAVGAGAAPGDDTALFTAVAVGRRVARELHGVTAFAKYRAMRKYDGRARVPE